MRTQTAKSYFRQIPAIKFEGRESDNPFAFRWYDENKVIAGKTLKEHFKFACAYWHSFNNTGADPFGESTHLFPWDEYKFSIDRARAKADAAFEFFTKMNLPYYCFHDVDLVDYTNDVLDNDKRLESLTYYLKEKQEETGVK